MRWRFVIFLKKIPLHTQILISLVLGVLYGVFAIYMGWSQWSESWVNPWAVIFVRLLKLIAVPLVVTSLTLGVASLSDLKKLSRMGGKTLLIYLCTTVVALTIGVVVALSLSPGHAVPESVQTQLQESYKDEMEKQTFRSQEKRGPLQPLVDMVPSNIFSSLSDNHAMLQIVFFSLLFGVALIQVERKKSRGVRKLLKGINEAIIQMVDMIMVFAPIGVFALMAQTVNAFASQGLDQVFQLLAALGLYTLAVILGLLIHSLVVFPTLICTWTSIGPWKFFKAIFPVQLLAFSTSSSGATLPVTMETCQRDLGISKEVSSFVLPLGATINMDGTGLYQAVATVFISQAMGVELGFSEQITIIITAVLASIGTAGVPGAGLIMLVVILESIGVPSAGIALILGVDRILDMLRTTVNVTGDATVAAVVASTERPISITQKGQLGSSR